MSKISSQTDLELSPVQKFLEIVKSGKKLPNLILNSPTAEDVNVLDASINDDALSDQQKLHIKKTSREILIQIYKNNENFNLNNIKSEEEKKRFTAIITVLPRIDNNELKTEIENTLLNPELDYLESLAHASVQAYRGGYERESGIIDILKGVYSNTTIDKSLDESLDKEISSHTPDYIALDEALDKEISSHTADNVVLDEARDKEISSYTADNRVLDEALDKEISSHTPDYIALKFKGETVDFNKLITKCSAKSVDIILKAAEKHSNMNNTPPSKWKQLLIEFSDFCKNRGRKSSLDNMREKLTNSNSSKPKPIIAAHKPQERDMDL